MNPLDSVWGTIAVGIALTILLDALVRAAF